MSDIYPIILSGGVGSRLWPLSRGRFPKQLLTLVGNQSLIQETALRTNGLNFAKPLIICQAEHRVPVAEQMRSIGVVPDKIILEPSGRNTAPAAAVAALTVAETDPDAVLLLMPADHAIKDRAALYEAILTARDLAKQGNLVTFGIHPHRPDTGYGYIQRGRALRSDGKAFAVSRFVEKPDPEAAERYVKTGDYYWNSGIFTVQAKTYLAELKRLQSEVVVQCQEALSSGMQDDGYFHLARDAFEACKSISIDYAVMEHTEKAAIVPVEMGWTDIGSWVALWDNSAKDESGNAVKGDVFYQDAHNSYLRSEGPLIATLGVSDLVVVADSDAVLVSSMTATQDIKKIVEQLKSEGRDLPITHRKVHHSWGSSERIDSGEEFEVNRITLNPTAALSLPVHDQLTRRWVVASGIARIVRNGEAFLLKQTETYAPSSAETRLENAGSGPLHIIETLALSD